MARRKNNNRLRVNWQYNLIWTVVALFIVGVLFMAINRKQNAEITTVHVSIEGIEGTRNLLSSKSVKRMFREYLGFDLEMSAIKDLNLRDMESMLEEDDRIKNAEVYVDNKDRLFIKIMQKKPIVRVMSSRNKSFYLDDEGNEIPVVKGATIRVPIASGSIEKYSRALIDSDKPNNLKSVYQVANHIQQDEFLSALIEQIDVDKEGEITLVPKVGRQKLAFGEAEELNERFEKLKVIYRKCLPQIGWRKYDVLKLKYKTYSDDTDQIVGVRRK